MSERFASFWKQMFLDVAKQYFPNIRGTNFDFHANAGPRWCIPSDTKGVAGCSVEGGGVVGQQAATAYPTEVSLMSSVLYQHHSYTIIVLHPLS